VVASIVSIKPRDGKGFSAAGYPMHLCCCCFVTVDKDHMA